MPRLFPSFLAVVLTGTPFCSGQNFSCTQTGSTVQWRVDRPIVKSAKTEYNNIIFRAGDRVSFGAGGCVQTGGSGKTWKRYKNPIPSNKYFGTIEIPDVLTLQPLRDINSTVIIPGNVPETHLVLGYVDDDYSDNGYWSPDRGNPPQCTIPGDAFVEITIQQSTISDACPKSLPKSFDVVIGEGGVDSNGFPINPDWGAQLPSTANQPPDADACHYAGNAGNPNPFDPKCTNFATAINAPTGFHRQVCGLSSSPAHGKPRAHFNWVPATFIAPIYWGSHQDPTIEDDDIDLWITPPHAAAITVGNKTQINGNTGIEVEFRMEETFRRFIRGAVAGWDEIVDAIDQEDNSQGGDPNGPHSKFDNRCAVVVGVLGLDCDHGCKSELHPAFVLALHTKDDPTDDTWLIFARNIGNEGYCSSKFEHLRLTDNRLAVVIPRPGAQLQKVLDSSRFFSALNNSSAQIEVSPSGANSPATVSFLFPADVPATPGQGEFILGELHLQWSNTATIQTGDRACGSSPSPFTMIRAAEFEETDGLLKLGIAREGEKRQRLKLQPPTALPIVPMSVPAPQPSPTPTPVPTPAPTVSKPLKIKVASLPVAGQTPSKLDAVEDPNQAAKQAKEREELCAGFSKKSAPAICK